MLICNILKKLISALIIQLVWFLSSLPSEVFGTSSLNPTEILQGLCLDARKMYFLTSINSLTNATTLSDKMEEISAADMLLGFTNLLISLLFELQFEFMVAIFAISALTIWTATNNFMRIIVSKFIKELGQNDSPKFASIKKEIHSADLFNNLNELITLGNAVNSAWKQVTFWIILVNAVWLAKDLDAVIKTDNYCMKVYVVIVIGYFSFGLILSAECGRKARKQVLQPKLFICGKYRK